MMRRVAELLVHDPGGWPRFSKAAFLRSAADEARIAAQIEKNRPNQPWEGFLLLLLFLGGMAYGLGWDFTFRFLLLFLLPPLCFVPAAVLRPFLLHGLPANYACSWPRDEKADRLRSYYGTVLSVSSYWMMSIVVFLNSALMMQNGLGDQWNPFTRTIHIVKGGPYSEYGLIEMPLIISGFFAITGLVWWPMIVFFEWLETRRPISRQEVAASA